jgi:hypothetical protein
MVGGRAAWHYRFMAHKLRLISRRHVDYGRVRSAMCPAA